MINNQEPKHLPKTKILKLKGDWNEVLNDSRFTVSKPAKEATYEPTDKFKKQILISEHTPIRDISIKWEWDDMPHWVTVHWVRHKFEKFVQSQRSDLTGVERHALPQDVPQSMICEANLQSLIDAMKKRLCFHASPETRQYAESLKYGVSKVDNNIGDIFVPSCIYRGGCPERTNCGFYAKFLEKHKDENLADIQTRYDLYNEDFVERITSDNE